MSEMSLLWHEYKRYNDLSHDVTENVIHLKRARLRLPGSESLTSEQRGDARKRLADFVGDVRESLAQNGDSIPSADLSLPGTLVRQIRDANSGVWPRFLAEIDALHQHLIEGEEALTDRDVEILDSLSKNVNVETSRVFNRLWRK